MGLNKQFPRKVPKETIDNVLTGTGNIDKFFRYFNKFPSEMDEGYTYMQISTDEIHMIVRIKSGEITAYKFPNINLSKQVDTYETKVDSWIFRLDQVSKVLLGFLAVVIVAIIVVQIAKI